MWGLGKLQVFPSALPRPFHEHAIQCTLWMIWLGWAWCTTRWQLMSHIIHPGVNMGLHSCWCFDYLMENRILESSASEKNLAVAMDSLPYSQPKLHATFLGLTGSADKFHLSYTYLLVGGYECLTSILHSRPVQWFLLRLYFIPFPNTLSFQRPKHWRALMLRDNLLAEKLARPSGYGIPGCKLLLISPLAMDTTTGFFSLNECLYNCDIVILFDFGSIQISFLVGKGTKFNRTDGRSPNLPQFCHSRGRKTKSSWGY